MLCVVYDGCRAHAIKINPYSLLDTQTMRGMEGERLAVTFKLRSPDTALLDFHTALTAAGQQLEPRYMAMLPLPSHVFSMSLTICMTVSGAIFGVLLS